MNTEFRTKVVKTICALAKFLPSNLCYYIAYEFLGLAKLRNGMFILQIDTKDSKYDFLRNLKFPDRDGRVILFQTPSKCFHEQHIIYYIELSKKYYMRFYQNMDTNLPFYVIEYYTYKEYSSLVIYDAITMYDQHDTAYYNDYLAPFRAMNQIIE